VLLPSVRLPGVFAALLGEPEHGRWLLAPASEVRRSTRRYRTDTLILESIYETAQGAVRAIDFMPPRGEAPDIVRIVEGLEGSVSMRSELVVRFDFGQLVPWVKQVDRALVAIAGPDALCFRTPLELRGENLTTVSEFVLHQGERVPFVLTWFPSHAPLPAEIDPEQALTESEDYWLDWATRCGHQGDYHDEIHQSLLVLKALTYAPTGGLVAAPTTSLPEQIGGERNWDYRYSWLRDSVFTVHALADLGFVEEADGFRRFIQRTAAGNADELQVLYGVDGRRRLTEITLPHLEGWRGSRPVRIGNAATDQYQGDMYGLLLELSWRWTERGNSIGPDYWEFLVKIVETAIERWPLPDRGIWEIRSAPRHFVTSKVMCWTAVDRGIALAEAHSLPAPFAHWRRVRDEIRAAIEEHGVDARRGNFVQCFGSTEVDAALLLLPEVKFVDYADERMQRTVEAIRTDLEYQGLVLRYRTQDGLRGDEGVFLPCSFWLAECLAKQGRRAEADAVFERACGCANDLGLYSEEYAVGQGGNGTMLGNFPQGLSHLAHISAAMALADLQAHAPTRVAPKTQGPGPAPSRR
jgi:GH15 family glucan-1,4-alpha-glucosidase